MLLSNPIDVDSENKNTFTESFLNCIGRIENFLSNNKELEEDFWLSLDSLARYGIVDFRTFLNDYGKTSFHDFRIQKEKWISWCAENNGKYEWNDGLSIYNVAITFIVDSLAMRKDFYSDLVIDSLGNEIVTNDIVYVKKMEGVTDEFGSVVGDKKIKVINSLYDDNGASMIRYVHYYKIYPIQVDRKGNLYINISDIVKRTIPSKYKNFALDPILCNSISELHQIKIDVNDGIPHIFEHRYLGERISFK